MSRARDLSNLPNPESLSVDGSSFDVGIGSTTPDSDLSVGTAIKMDGASGVITATSFSGSGSGLSGISSITDFGYLKQLKVSGVVTATSFAGDGSALTGVANTDYVVGTALTMVSVKVSGSATVDGQLSVGGTITYEDVTNVDSVGIVTGRLGLRASGGGLQVVGVSTLTGNVAVTGDVAVGIANSINLGTGANDGSVFLRPRAVGLGSTTTDGRAAGVGTAIGEMVYVTDASGNGASGQIQVYNGDNWFAISSERVSTPMVASGGNTVETVDGYKRHIFTTPGNFVVSSDPGPVTVLVIGGGGAGGGSTGNGQAGGGGAGGFRLASAFPVPAATYPVTIGSGAAGAGPPSGGFTGASGTPSSFGSTPAITATGGGGGGGYPNPGGSYTSGTPGGSGGGDSNSGETPGEGNVGGNDPRCSPIAEGTDGGNSTSNSFGTGGGGAGQSGQGDGTGSGGAGGAGTSAPLNVAPPTLGTPGPTPARWFAGGGGGGGPGSSGGVGGGGAGGAGADGSHATASTGGGGGGAQGPMGTNREGGDGGSGIVIISYQA